MTSARSAIHQVDERVDAYFAELRGNAVADRVFYTASALGDFGLMWVMLALVRALRGRPNDERAAIRAIVATIVESILVNAGLKTIFRRRRPLGPTEHPLPFRQPLTSSFPSGHSTAAFCAATLLSDGDRFGPLYFAAATVVAVSRIHVRTHHASDVVGGAAIGLALGAMCRAISPLPSSTAKPAKGLPSR